MGDRVTCGSPMATVVFNPFLWKFSLISSGTNAGAMVKVEVDLRVTGCRLLSDLSHGASSNNQWVSVIKVNIALGK